MKLYTVKNNQIFQVPGKKDVHILLTSWKPDNSLKEGIYEIHVYYESQTRKLAKINYVKSQNNKWNSFDDFKIDILYDSLIEVIDSSLFTIWTFIPNTTKFKLVLKNLNSELTSSNWEFRFMLKSINGKMLVPSMLDTTIDTNNSSECTQILDTTNPRNADSCPIDPVTHKPMEMCVNWRRTDDIGKECRKILSHDDIDKSIDNFCSKYTDAQDCNCVNRAYSSNYNKLKTNYPTTDDYCWYESCKSGAYLIKNQHKPVTCSGVTCIINYNATDTAGNAVFSKNTTHQSCAELSVNEPRYQPTQTNSFWLLSIIAITLIVLVLLH